MELAVVLQCIITYNFVNSNRIESFNPCFFAIRTGFDFYKLVFCFFLFLKGSIPTVTFKIRILCKSRICITHLVFENFLCSNHVQLFFDEGVGRGGGSLFQLLYGDQARYFDAETMPKIKHHKIGMIYVAAPVCHS